MGIALACPGCGARMEFPQPDAGRAGHCPSCRGPVLIPQHLKTCQGCQRLVAAELTVCPACGVAMVSDLSSAAAASIQPLTPGAAGETSLKAVLSLVFGFMSVVLTCVTGLPAILLGILALGDIRRSGGHMSGRGPATAGIVLGSVGSLCALPLLFALLLPAIHTSREAARRAQCRGHLKQIGLALHNYHTVWGSFPPAYSKDAAGQPLLSWRVLILPYLAQQELYDQFRLDEPWNSANNLPLAGWMPEVFRCPSDDSLAADQTSYMAITGAGTVFPPNRTVRVADIVDGTGTTAMIGERDSTQIIWTQPEDFVLDEQFTGSAYWSSHPTGSNLLMADGTVQFIDASTDPDTLRRLMTISAADSDTSF